MARMLNEAEDVVAFRECLFNRAPFDVVVISKAIVACVMSRMRYVLETSDTAINVALTDQFVAAASVDFLRNLVEIASSVSSPAGDAVAWVSLAELHSRNITVSREMPIAICGANIGVEHTRQ